MSNADISVTVHLQVVGILRNKEHKAMKQGTAKKLWNNYDY